LLQRHSLGVDRRHSECYLDDDVTRWCEQLDHPAYHRPGGDELRRRPHARRPRVRQDAVDQRLHAVHPALQQPDVLARALCSFARSSCSSRRAPNMVVFGCMKVA
jgi:hypothetical protein